MSSTNAPNRLIYYQVQEYTTYLFKKKKVCCCTFNLGFSTTYLFPCKTIESIIVVDMDENEKIIRLVDQWNGHELPNWFGASFLRVLIAKITPWLIRVPMIWFPWGLEGHDESIAAYIVALVLPRAVVYFLIPSTCSNWIPYNFSPCICYVFVIEMPRCNWRKYSFPLAQ